MTIQEQKFSELFNHLHEEAKRRTGLNDFGASHYEAHLRYLLQSYDQESLFDEGGKLAIINTLTDCLVGRLKTTEQIRVSTGCLQGGITRPFFVIGLPRTGTTALHKLLSADPNVQYLEYWIACNPATRPPRDTWPTNSVYLETEAGLEAMYSQIPGLRSIHDMSVDAADECRLLLMQDFASMTFASSASVPSYEQWIINQDMTSTYEHYRDNLKLIGANEPEKRWVLKNPGHLWAMDALTAVFPDCCIIHPYRDPAQLVASISSLVYRVRKMHEPEITKQAVGAQQLAQWSRNLDKFMESRKRIPAGQILDVDYRDFIAEPISVVAKIYDYFDLPWTDQVESSLQAWSSNNKQGKHGDHQYGLEEYGLEYDAVREKFADYISRFDL